MTTTLGAPPVTSRRQSLVLCVGVAVAVVAVCLATERAVIYHVAPRLAGHWPHALLTELQLLVTVAAYAVFALALAVWGLSARHRLAGSACALVAGLLAWGIPYAYFKIFYEHDHLTQTSLRVFDWTITLVLPTVLALAWGLARRSGAAWIVGVGVAPALAWVHRMLQLHSPRVQSWEIQHHDWWLLRLEFLAPVIIAAVVCAAMDRRTPATQSSA